MKNHEKQTEDIEVNQDIPEISKVEEDEKEKRARAISRYIEKQVIGANESLNVKEEEEIKDYYEKMGPREKADVLYGKIMEYAIDKQIEFSRKKEAKKEGEKFEPEEPDPYLISEVKILFGDEAAWKTFVKNFSEARVDAKNFRHSELGMIWNNIHEEIKQKEEKRKDLEKDLHLNKISGRGKISVAKTRLNILTENLLILEQRRNSIEKLEGFQRIPENTDAAAQFQYESLVDYKEQLKEGFVWLPSRKEIHKKTISAILNHRQPLLIGEAGSGKSKQADAAAIELTGYPPAKIECESITGEKQLIKDKEIDPATGGSYESYGAIMQAFTGYEDSRQQEAVFKTGRIARLDEAGRLGSRSYSIIKRAHQDQKEPGADFYGHPVLPGAGVIGTTNPPGVRYPDRNPFDPAMRREWSEIQVPYPEMSEKNPELYEFAIAALLDENNHISIAKQELAPAYFKKEIQEDQREILDDGSIVVAKDEIIPDMSDAKHGSLWRFCGAIKSLQDSFVYGNAETEKYPETLLRFKEDDDGDIKITAGKTGEPLTLSTSTVTVGELASWMSGFDERLQRQDVEFHVNTLTEWLDFKIKTYLEQADKSDKGKIEAIFRHFHFLENKSPEVRHDDPLTPKEIGYLSPRVPRPVYVERPQKEKAETAVEKSPNELKEYETKQVLLEDGGRILIKEQDFMIGEGKNVVSITPGKKFRIKGEDFSLAGAVEDEKSEHNGKPVGQLATEENLYRIFGSEELDMGVLSYESEELMADIGSIKEDVEDFCKFEN